MAPHSSTVARKIPWMEEPGRPQSMGLLRVRHDFTFTFTFTFHFHALEKEMATHSSVLAWRIPGTEKTGRLQSTGSHRVGHDYKRLSSSSSSSTIALLLGLFKLIPYIFNLTINKEATSLSLCLGWLAQ